MAKKKEITKEDVSGMDLADIIKNGINKQFKDITAAHFLDDVEDVETWIPSGNDILDLCISNRKNGGYPSGRVITLFGGESSGKTLIAAHAIAECQKLGGVGIFYDIEQSISKEFLYSLGVNGKKLIHITDLEKLEDVFASFEKIIESIPENNKKPICVVIDSIAAATTEQEMESDYGKDGWNTSKAIILSKAMRKLTGLIAKRNVLLIAINQIRDNLGVSFGETTCLEPFTTNFKVKYLESEDNYVVKEMSFADFATYFNITADFDNPNVFDISDMNIQIMTYENDLPVWKDIYQFVVKSNVDFHYTDSKLMGTDLHRIFENGKDVYLKDHKDFYRVNEKMQVADLSVQDDYYFANGRINHNTEPGGRAMKFHSSVRIQLKTMGKIKATINGQEQIIGVDVQAEIKKNKVGPPFKKCKFKVFFNSGIDRYGSWLETLKDYGIIKQGGAWYSVVNENTGEEHKFQEKTFKNLILEENKELKDYLYNKICEKMIVEYKKETDFTSEDIEVDSDDLEE